MEFLKISIVKEGCSVFSYFPAWRYAYAGLEFKRISSYIWLQKIMILLERSTSIVFSVHSLSFLKKLILHDRGKDSRLIFNNSTKLTKILLSWWKEFNATGFVSCQYEYRHYYFFLEKIRPCYKYVKKKSAFHTMSWCTWNFSELQCLIDV